MVELCESPSHGRDAIEPRAESPPVTIRLADVANALLVCFCNRPAPTARRIAGRVPDRPSFDIEHSARPFARPAGKNGRKDRRPSGSERRNDRRQTPGQLPSVEEGIGA